MRRHLAILRTTALEVCSEPLTFLLTLTALGCAAILPALHFHQFGESSRMARDAGLSALLIVGLAYSVFCTVKPYRREIESGTLQMALAASVSRPGFFLAKLAGVFLAYLVFAVTVTCVALTAVNGAELGGALAAKTGDIAKMYGPSLALAVSVLVLPPVLAAALNRFLRFRFVPTATFLSLVLAAGAAAFRFSPHLAARFLPAAVLLVFPAAVFMAAAAAFAVRWPANAATALMGVLFALQLPFLGDYYLSDALSRGGTVPWSFVGLAALATLPLVAAFALLGIRLFKDRDYS